MIAFIVSIIGLLWAFVCSVFSFVMMIISPMFWLFIIGFFLFGVYCHATEGFINW